MAWLGTWAKRRSITVDNTNIDSDLTQFPIAIVLGTSIGQSSQDVSSIFDELGSESLKIAITKANGTTQIYGDIELWDDPNEKAVIHVAKSDLDITSASTTTLYIYYDSTESDNTTYIGLSGGTAAQSVWDSNFEAVYHMNQDPSGSAPQMLDSTSNNLDGTSNGSMTSGDLIDGNIGKALELDGSNDYINIGSPPTMTSWTIESIVNITTITSAENILSNDRGGFNNDLLFGVAPETGAQTPNGLFGAVLQHSISSNRTKVWDPASPSTATWYYVTISSDAADFKMYVDESLVDTSAKVGPDLTFDGATTYIGATPNTLRPWNGKIAEIRISDTDRTADWLKATHYTLIDDMLVYGSEETPTPVGPPGQPIITIIT